MERTSNIEVENTVIQTSELDNERSFWQTRLGEALKDYFDGILQWHLWSRMAFADIRRRYKRTLIGPFWTTLSLAIFVTSMGFLFSILWHTNVKNFLPYFASGYICWIFFSTIITDGCQTFTANDGLIKQVVWPYSMYACLIVARSFLVFLHQIIVFVVIATVFQVKINLNTLLAIPGLLLLFLSGNWIAILLGFLCARYRDMQQVIVSLLQVSMFVTPIFWPQTQLGHSFKAYILMNGNPLYHYITIVRQPLLGEAPSLLSWWVVIVITLLGWLFTLFVMARKQRKLIFWLL